MHWDLNRSRRFTQTPITSLPIPQPFRRKVKGLKDLDTGRYPTSTPVSILVKGKYGISKRKKEEANKNKIIQLIILLIGSSEFTAGPRKKWKKGGQRGQTWGRLFCPSLSGERAKEPPAKFSFSHLLFFFFFMGHPECKKYDLALWCSNRNEAIKL